MVGRTNWRAVAVAYLAGVLAAAQVGRVAPSGTAIIAEFDLSLAGLGWAVSLITLASAFGGLGAGLLVQKTGARRVLIVGSILLGVSVMLSAVAPTASALLSMRVLEGVGYLCMTVAAPTLIAQSAASKDIAPALALWGTFFTFGISLAAFTGGWVSDVFGWRVWNGINGATFAAILPVIFWCIPSDGSIVDVEHDARFNWSLPSAIWLLGLGFFGVTLTALAILSMMPSFLVQLHDFSPSLSGTTTGFVALSSILGSAAYGVLTKRVKTDTVVLLAIIGTSVAIFPAYSSDGPATRGIALAALAVAGTGVLVAHVFASVPRMVGHGSRIGPANGLVAQIGSIGSLLGPPLVGGLVTVAGWSALSVLVALCALAFLLLAILAERSIAD